METINDILNAEVGRCYSETEAYVFGANSARAILAALGLNTGDNDCVVVRCGLDSAKRWREINNNEH